MVSSKAPTVDTYLNDIPFQRVEAIKKALAHLNCGKSCIRFKSLDQLPLDTIENILDGSAKRASKA